MCSKISPPDKGLANSTDCVDLNDNKVFRQFVNKQLWNYIRMEEKSTLLVQAHTDLPLTKNTHSLGGGIHPPHPSQVW